MIISVVSLILMLASTISAFPNLSERNFFPVINSDPELMMNASQMIERWGYPVELYDVVTEDGYILTLFRIPYGRNESPSTNQPNKTVVYLQHGLEGDCTNWISNLPSESAGFMFADGGFDVWMGNFRGCTYGKRHVTMTSKQHEFWQFTWDQMAKYDLPALIETVLSLTNQTQLYYVGHSEGTLTAFAEFSQNKTLANKIKKFFALAPLSTLKHVQGPLKWIAQFTNILQDYLNWMGVDEFWPSSIWMKLMAKFFCTKGAVANICDDVIFLIAGPDSNQLNTSRVPVYISHTPAGTSTNNIVHFGQLIKSGLMQMYDYGSKKENRNHYSQDVPPLYDVTQMEVPVALYYGSNDWLATPTDVESLIPKLKNMISNNYLIGYNHLDYIWGLRAASEIYVPIMNTIKADSN